MKVLGPELLHLFERETPSAFHLYAEENVVDGRVVVKPLDVGYYENNWFSTRHSSERLLSCLRSFTSIEILQSHGTYSIEFESCDEMIRFKNIAENFERYANRLPDTVLGNWLLSAMLSDTWLDSVPVFLRKLEEASHSEFGCHVLEMAYACDHRSLKFDESDYLVVRTDEYGELTSCPSVRIPLRAGDGCPFYAISLVAVGERLYDYGDAHVTFDFAVQVEQGAPWTLLTTNGSGKFSVPYYVKKYAVRHIQQTDPRKPFK